MTTRRKPRRSAARGKRGASRRAVSPDAVDVLRAPKPVLVATDGSRIAGSAVKWAKRMADRGAWAPEAMTVLEPAPLAVGEMGFGTPPANMYQAFSDSVLGRIRAQLARHGASSWPLTVQFGRAAPTIAQLARERGAAAIVLGLGAHGRLARLVGAETAVRVVRLSNVPVLAVEGGVRHLPSTALVAMDFGESSVRAAREALALLEPPGRLHLLHVRWALNGKLLFDSETEQTFAIGVEESFRRITAALDPSGDIEITHEMRLGGVIETTPAVAEKIGADLIAVGSHSHTVVDRLLIGSTPAQLLRAAKCSVLVAPPST